MSTWHERRSAAITELDKRLDAGERMILAGHALVETYAVLTRLPAPYRLSARDARALVAANFLEGAELVALDAAQYRGLLDRALALGVVGGQVYDLVIAECARQAGAQALLTFNPRHFRRLADRAVEIVVPGEEADGSVGEPPGGPRRMAAQPRAASAWNLIEAEGRASSGAARRAGTQ